MKEISDIKKSAFFEIASSRDAETLEKIRVSYLGRKGSLTNILKLLKNFPLEERQSVGPVAQALKKELETAIRKKTDSLVSIKGKQSVDLTAPGKKIVRGHLHPLTLVDQETRRIFRGMNFSIVEGPEAETEYYNFDALNIPQNHPAREAWDTFWLRRPNGVGAPTAASKQSLLLRTHTSPMQIRYMEAHTPPLQIVVPGRVFRYEATDVSHEVNFYQLEGLMVGKDVNLANFKFVVEEFFRKFFGRKIEFRFRPSYFPFVEPGVEVDIKLEKGGKWLEVMGAGMVHPRVFEYAHYNPRDWQGFAFGMGIDRLAMIKYKIPDIRLFYSGDLRFIRQF